MSCRVCISQLLSCRASRGAVAPPVVRSATSSRRMLATNAEASGSRDLGGETGQTKADIIDTTATTSMVASSGDISQEIRNLEGLTVTHVSSGVTEPIVELWGSQQGAVVAFFTHYGDFDSWEYAQRLRPHIKDLMDAKVMPRSHARRTSCLLPFLSLPFTSLHSDRSYRQHSYQKRLWRRRFLRCLPQVRVVCIGIGSLESARRFCDLTEFPREFLWTDPAGAAHRALGFSRGLQEPAGVSPYVRLMAMCAGLGSPGTLPAVFQGYQGSKDRVQLFNNTPSDPRPVAWAPLFDVVGKGYQRPFELATLR